MADRKRFQFADPDSGAELELSLGPSKATSKQSGREEKKRKKEEQWAVHRKGWEYYWSPWYGYGAQYMPFGNAFGHPQAMPCWPPATFMPNVFPAPFTLPQTSSESSGSDDQFSTSSIQYTEGSRSSGSSKKSDARSRQVSMVGSTKGKGEINYKERFVSCKALRAEQAASFVRMPCVLTTGNGPQGRTIVGFLNRYCDKEISIVCVCHGTCFSPAEFVKHAGGADVSNPLRQIIVVPS
ncbi:hypothetical protein J5N97_020449 [Dioscorea zingiberensis]|uniref:Ninja-family protein n=1 Tax=Dioscorea zingiberensis TaxID=325984 RepID=A0A9D5CI09_9LILI|nr:hypothetical protein J5N97_020449 [Dioscorea zingiberensis]